VLATAPAGNRGAAVVLTDKDDYAPGTTVVMTGFGFAAGETVTLTLTEDPEVHTVRSFTVTADENGDFEFTGFAPEEHDIGVRFVLTAKGEASGRFAQTTFTDDKVLTVVKNGTGAGTVTSSVSSKNGQSINCGTGSACAASFDNNETVTLTAAPSAGSIITGWSVPASFTSKVGCGPSDLTCAFNLDNTAGTVTVTFSSSTGTSTALASSQNPSAFGQSVTFTATVSPSSGTTTPTGTVQFQVDGVNLGTAVTLSSGTATSLATTTLAVGTHSVSANYTPTGSFTASSGTLSQVVGKASQTITFASLANKTYGDAEFTVGAMASSGLAVSFASQTLAKCTVSGTTVSIEEAGTCTIRASQSGDANYSAAPSVDQSFTIAKAEPTLTDLAGPTIAYGTSPVSLSGKILAGALIPPGSVSIVLSGTGGAAGNASATIGGDGSFSTSVTTAGLAAGQYDIAYSYVESANFLGASDATRKLTISKAAGSISITGPSTLTFGQTGSISPTVVGDGTVSYAVTSGGDVCSVNGTTGIVTMSKGTGSCQVQATLAEGTNYSGDDSEVVTITAAKATATITLADLSHTYDGTAKAATAVTAPVGLSGVTLTYFKGAVAVASPTSAGSYDVKATLTNADYALAPASDPTTGTLVIDQRTASVTPAVGQGKVYGGVEPMLTGTLSGFLAADGVTASYSRAPGEDVGSYAMTATLSPSGGLGNYAITYNPASFEITKATSTVTVSCPTTPQTYTGTSQTPCTARATGAGGLDVDVTSVTHTSNVDVGTASASAEYAGDANHTGNTGSGSFAIAKARATISVTGYTGVYDGAAHGATGSATGVNGENLGGLLSLGASFTDVPGGTATWSFAGNTNYEAGTGTAAITITPATPVLNVAWAGGAYTGSAFVATGSVTGVGSPAADLGTPSFTYYSGATAAGAPLGDAPTTVGTYTVRASYAATTNYAAAFADRTIEITKKSITVTASDRTKSYGDAVTFEGTEFSVTPGGLVGGDQITTVTLISAGAASAATVADSPYDIVASTAVGSGLGNYDIGYVVGKLTVNRATLVVTPANKTKTYGEEFTAFTGAVVGAVAGDIFGATYSSAGAPALAEVSGSPYAIVATLVDDGNRKDNYDVELNTGTLTVDKAPSVTAVTVGNATYDGSSHGGTAAATGVGALNESLTVTYVGRNGTTYSSPTPPTDAGDYTASATYNGGPNHLGSTDSEDFSIARANPTIAAVGGSFPYNGSPRAGSGSATGVNNESLGPVTLSYTGTGATVYAPSATAPTDAGIYTVTASYAGSGNYNPGTSSAVALEITKIDATIAVDGYTGVYDGAAHGATGTATGVSGANLGSLLSLGASFTDVPGGTANWTFVGDRNYNPAAGTVAIVITKADQTITWVTPAAITYGTLLSAAQLNATVAGVSGGSAPGALTYDRNEGDLLTASAAGHLLTANAAETQNYKPASNSVTLVVNKAALTVTPANKTKTYGEEFTTFTGAVVGAVATDVFDASYASTGAVATAPVSGSPYSITATLIDAGNRAENYDVTLNTGSLTVGRKALTITARSTTKIYGQTITFTGSEFSSGAGELVNSDAVSSVTLTSAGAAATATVAGSPYTIVASAAVGTGLDNYTIGYVDGSLAVTKATLTITGPTLTREYGEANPSLAGTFDGQQNAETFTVSGSTTADATSPVAGSPYDVVPAVTGATLDNYTVAPMNGKLTITKATLTVKADDAGRLYGQANPQFTALYSGFKNGETLATSGVAGMPSLTSTATSTTFPGTYDIDAAAGSLVSSNYTFAFIKGTLTIGNVKPVITSVTPPAAPVALGSPVLLNGTFTDVGVANDEYTITSIWTSGTSAPTTVTSTTTTYDGNAGTFMITAPSSIGVGVYTVKVTVTDRLGAASDEWPVSGYVVIYDPSGGFVTGGGWINSPAGAYAEDLSLQGRANFGFVSKYERGAKIPTGHTEFQFKAGNLDFKSRDYEWLVISGARAQYKGTGTINGAGSYSFMLTSIDGQVSGGGGVDKFRLKILDLSTGATVYDNQLGAADEAAPSTALSGGSIVIHEAKGGK
jgi:hypothetical protein